MEYPVLNRFRIYPGIYRAVCLSLHLGSSRRDSREGACPDQGLQPLVHTLTLEKNDGFISKFLVLIGRPIQQVIRPGEILDWKNDDRKDGRIRRSRSRTVAGLHVPGFPSKKSDTSLHCTPFSTTTVSLAEWRKRYGTRDKRQDLSPSQMWPPPKPHTRKKTVPRSIQLPP